MNRFVKQRAPRRPLSSCSVEVRNWLHCENILIITRMHKLSQERCPTMMLQERAWSNVGGLEKIGPRKAANMLKRELNTDPDRSDKVVDYSFPLFFSQL